MKGKNRNEWLVTEVRAAQEDVARLPGWKKDIFRSKDEQTRHSSDRDDRGSNIFRATHKQQGER